VDAEVGKVIRTLRLKVKPEGYRWLNAAAIEVNQVWTFANETCFRAVSSPCPRPYKWLSSTFWHTVLALLNLPTNEVLWNRWPTTYKRNSKRASAALN
jgi:hypothetical protein